MNTLNRPTALAIGAVTLIAGAIGPWINVLGLISGGPTTSLELAIIVFGGIALVLVSALTGRFMRPVSIIVGLAVLGEAIRIVVQMHTDNELGLVQSGWGLYISILAGTFLLASTWVAKKSA